MASAHGGRVGGDRAGPQVASEACILLTGASGPLNKDLGREMENLLSPHDGPHIFCDSQENKQNE